MDVGRLVESVGWRIFYLMVFIFVVMWIEVMCWKEEGNEWVENLKIIEKVW